MLFEQQTSLDLNNLGEIYLDDFLTAEERKRVSKDKTAWNFYEGYHWEQVPMDDKPQITENYCRRFVDKFVSFEFGLGFNINVPYEKDTDENVITKYLNEVWDYNNRQKKCIEIGQSKGVTGRSWVQVKFEEKGEFPDPFEEYPKGRIRLMVLPSSLCFPEYNEYDKDILEKLTIAFPVRREEVSPILKKTKEKITIERQVWTHDKVAIYEGKTLKNELDNPYGVIPFVQILNYPLVGKSTGLSDLEDLIPLNMELNLKNSDVSEIIDYHSAPVTIVFGATVSSLEKGANKMWGGLPKDAKVENLQLNSDLSASINYIKGIKKAMHEVGSVPEGSLGAEQAISNTSGIALQISNMPLIERTRVKRMCSSEGIQALNKLILYISFLKGLINKPSSIDNKILYKTEVTFPDTLPKDDIVELQKIETELRLGLDSRTNAMRKLGKNEVNKLIQEIDEDKKKQQELFFKANQFSKQNNPNNADGTRDKNNEGTDKKLNSGITNGETPIETVRKESTGKNG